MSRRKSESRERCYSEHLKPFMWSEYLRSNKIFMDAIIFIICRNGSVRYSTDEDSKLWFLLFMFIGVNFSTFSTHLKTINSTKQNSLFSFSGKQILFYFNITLISFQFVLFFSTVQMQVNVKFSYSEERENWNRRFHFSIKESRQVISALQSS